MTADIIRILGMIATPSSQRIGLSRTRSFWPVDGFLS